MKTTIELPDTERFEVGELCLCWYNIIPSIPRDGIDLFWCKVLSMGSEYCAAELFFGEDSPTKSKGVFNDVCVADLVKHAPETH